MNKLLHNLLHCHYDNFLSHKKANAFTALLLAALLCLLSGLSQLPVYAAAELDTENAIHLSTPEDLLSFSKSCTTDTWSQGKLIVLDNDINLEGTKFSPIPTFGGTFMGQGHTISGILLEGGSDSIGLFRYLQEDGAIYQLSVSGSCSAQSTHSGLALLVGTNYGLINNCRASGNVSGGKMVGSIAGINKETGVITGCAASGSIYGEHLIGGITGENLGSLSDCRNHCDVNTIAVDNSINLSSINVDKTLTDILTTENAASVTDIGGITGSNSGTVRACVNDGSVGYQHVGYNIGGIAGSQTGYIEGCINYGVLNGRKDIGGIAGQMEPSSELEFEEDMLQKLDAEFDKLHDQLTKLDQDAASSSNNLGGQISQLLNSVEGAQWAIDTILDQAGEDFSSFSELTDLGTLSSPRPISLDFLDKFPTPSLTPSATPSGEEPTPSATPTGTPDAAEPDPDDAPADDLGEGESAPDNDPGAAAPADDPDAAAPTPTATPAGEQDEEEPAFPWRTPDGLPLPTGDLNWEDFYPDIDRDEVEKSINDAQQHVYEDASGLLQDIQQTVRAQAALVGSRFSTAHVMLSGSFSSIISDTRTLSSLLNGENQVLLDDFQAIVDELNVITDLITNPDTIDPDDVLEDVSDQDQLTDITGKVMNSVNRGTVNGDLNVGGIAGSLSRENNLDPENDMNLDQYDSTLNFRYKERIVIRQCENLGKVIGKKDCIGGIAGEMMLGSILECTNRGSLSSDGSKVGGIAGFCASTIRKSSAKCSLSGADKIGGIAGEGTVISDCRSMVEIRRGENYLGSIAGSAASLEDISECYFVEGCPAGIDGISYTGKAQPLDYQEFMLLPDLPDCFQNIYLTFEADESPAATITLAYGGNFDPARLPQVPPKEGYIGAWADFDMANITFDQTIEAVYTEYITTIESDLKDDVHPILLAEGIFTPDDTLSISEINAYPDDAKTVAECYRVHLNSSSDETFTFRFLIPQEMENPQLEILQDQTWITLDAQRDGSYYVFTLADKNFVFSCVDRPRSFSTGTIAVLLLLLAVLLGAFMLLRLFSRKR